MVGNSKRAWGWRPDLPDHRDWRFAPRVARRLPMAVTLRPKMGPVLDQGSLGACTAHAASAAFTFLHPTKSISRLALYYAERELEGSIDWDAGAYVRDAIKVLNKTGCAHETLWPYDVSKFAKRPGAKARADAKSHKISAYLRLRPIDYAMCLAEGFPFIIGFSVFESFESKFTARTGRVKMPGPKEASLGGHAVCVIGYESRWGQRHYEVRNSWGGDWGDEGNFWIPATYLESLDLADDAWTIRA